MLAPFSSVQEAVVYALILLATSALTLLHLGVLGLHAVRRRLVRRRGQASPLAPGRPPPSRASLTFVVPVHNEEMTIGPCIESILAQSVPAEAVVVVDDASTDGTAAAIAPYLARGVTCIRLEENGGKTRAIEAALPRVTTELVAITDADSIVHPDYVKEILSSFEDPEVAGAGGVVESIPHTWVTASRQVDYMITLKLNRRAESEMGSLLVLPGVSSTYRTRVLVEMGFEHDTIAEDFDLTFRLHRAGHRIVMNEKAIVYTSDPPTLRSFHRQLSRWYTDLWITIRKHRDMLGRGSFGGLQVPLLALNLLAYSVLIFALPVYLWFFDRPRFAHFFLWELAMDFVFVGLTWHAYRRRDVWWAVLSRFPTRVIARFATLVAFARVMVGRPGRAWKRLERRSTSRFLGALSAPARGSS